MRKRISIVGVTGVAAVLGLCCGIPVLLSLGVLGAVAGVSWGSWVLIALGAAAAVVGVRRRVRRNAARQPGPAGRRGVPRSQLETTGPRRPGSAGGGTGNSR